MLPTLLGAGLFLALMAGLFVPLEAWAPIAPGRSRWRTAFALFLVNTLLMQLIGPAVFDRLGPWAEAPSLARLAMVFLLAEIAGYWAHRAMHAIPWLWRFHAVHHAPTQLTWVDAWRQHPVDFAFHGLVVGLPGALLGASLSDVASLVLLRKAFTTFLHANVRVRLGWLEELVASPAFHRLHHSAAPGDFGHNLAGTFPWIDRLFGTHRRSEDFPATLGILG